MEVRRIVLGANPSARITHLPDQCVSDRTITLNKLGVLQIFRDKRLTARTWIKDNLPRLAIMEPDKMEKLHDWFWNEMPDNGWLEFDFGRKTLVLCLLEKVSPK